MLDDNWDLINGPDAHDIEVLNYSSQINVIEALVKFLFHHSGGKGTGCSGFPNAEALCEIHRTGTLFLLEKPGVLRTIAVNLQKQDGTVVYAPPPWEEVEAHTDEFIKDLGKMWLTSSPIQVAAFCLWKINWIHPFKNGNGRTARAFMYACLCLKYGLMLPGSPTIIDLITANKKPFEEALGEADKIFAETNQRDCSQLENYLEGLLIEQLSTIPVE
ncbi:MAG: Fic family protein [Afipia sp.]|jgi:Fic family protein|nr:Fic family protein [Afipia sp.]